MDKYPISPEERKKIKAADEASRAEAAQILGPQVAEQFFAYTDAKRQELKPSSITREEAYMYWQNTGSEEGF